MIFIHISTQFRLILSSFKPILIYTIHIYTDIDNIHSDIDAYQNLGQIDTLYIFEGRRYGNGGKETNP